ncbi:MAG: DUF2254 domain-containing protein [Euzebya sp.]
MASSGHPGEVSVLVKARTVLDRLRASLWFMPAIAITMAVALGTALVSLRQILTIPDSALFVGDLNAARSLMQVLAGSTITVTGLVFTLTVVSLQVASGQYSPRLLGNFLRDVGNQVVLSTFLATFAYAMAVLRVLPAGSGSNVPRLSITVGMVLAAVSLISLVYFIDHMAQSIRIENILSKSVKAVLASIDQVAPDPIRVNAPVLPLPDVPDQATVVRVTASGYVQAMSATAMLKTVGDVDAVVRLRPTIGDYVVEGATLAWVWGHSERLDDAAVQRVETAVQEAVQIGSERINRQDIAYGLRQIVDVIARALSPGVNDPTTAVDALGHLAEPMARLAQRRIDPKLQLDDEGIQRVGIPALDFADYLELACGQPRRYGADEPTVLAGVLRMLAEIIDVTESESRRQAVITQVNVLLEDAERALQSTHDLDIVRGLALRLIGDLSDSPTQQGVRLG